MNDEKPWQWVDAGDGWALPESRPQQDTPPCTRSTPEQSADLERGGSDTITLPRAAWDVIKMQSDGLREHDERISESIAMLKEQLQGTEQE